MTDTPLPVLWLYGPPGVGKSTVAWELFTQLAQRGNPTGYVDVDQLGMCYPPPSKDKWAPEPASDPGRHRMEARNLDAFVANFQAAGAQCLVVSGVVDAARGIDIDLIPHAALTRCRLRSEPHELRQRLSGRGRPEDQVDEVLAYADALDRNHTTDLCIDTTGRNVTDVLQLLRRHTGGWPVLTGPTESPVSDATEMSKPYRTVTSAGKVLWLCGATAVGKSTVGWQIYQQVRAAGFRAAFVDLDQIGFYRPAPDEDPSNHRLKASNLAAIWQTYRASGAQRLIIVGPVDRPNSVRRYTAALPAATITLCRLHASQDQLTERIMLRGRGQGPLIAGDELNGQSAAQLRHATDKTAAEAEALQRAAIGDVRIDTDGRPVDDIAHEILRRTGLLDRPGDVFKAQPRPTTAP